MEGINPIHEILLGLWFKPAPDWSVERCESTLFTLLDEGMDPNLVFHERGFYPLFYVLSAGMTLPMVEKLIEKGADVNFQALKCASPIHRLDSRFLDKADVLFKAGMDVNQLNLQGETALHGAMREGDKAWIEWLIRHGADLMFVSDRGKTPMEVAGLSQKVSIPERVSSMPEPESVRDFAIRIAREVLAEQIPETSKEPNGPRL